MTHPAYLDNETWSDHSVELLIANDINLTTAEIEENAAVDQCAACGEVVPPVEEDRCPECGAEGNMCTGREFDYNRQTYFVSYR